MYDKKEKEKFLETEDVINIYDFRAIGKQCSICREIFSIRAINESVRLSKFGLKNIPVLMPAIPGYVHRRCRGNLTGEIISNPVEKKDLRGMV